jgi:hypothetical protein
MTLSEFYLEIESDLSSFAKDINRTSVKTNVINQLRVFGTNVTGLNEKVEIVKNSRVHLPDDFKSLKLALRLNGIGYNTQGAPEPTEQIIRQRIENGAWFDQVNQEYVTTCDPKIITEKIIIDNSTVNFFYEPTWLSLVPGIKKDGLDSKCLNLHPSIRNTYHDEINITNGVINTNFSSGQIYLQYNALQTDEDGDLIIPEYTTGDIYEYIKLYCKVKIAEDLVVNGKNAQGLGQMYSVWSQQLPLLKKAALTEARFAGLPKNWQRKFKEKNRKETIAFYNLPGLPNV